MLFFTWMSLFKAAPPDPQTTTGHKKHGVPCPVWAPLHECKNRMFGVLWCSEPGLSYRGMDPKTECLKMHVLFKVFWEDHLWTTFGPLLDHFGITFGPLLDHFWTIFGLLLDLFLTTFKSVFKSYTRLWPEHVLNQTPLQYITPTHYPSSEKSVRRSYHFLICWTFIISLKFSSV